MLCIMLFGWILTLFCIDTLIVNGIDQIFNMDYNVAIYWLILFSIGIIRILISSLKKQKEQRLYFFMHFFLVSVNKGCV